MTKPTVVIELRALDPSGREAFVHRGGLWHRVFFRKSWWCWEELGPDEPLALQRSESLVRLRRDYPSFPSFADLVTALTAVVSSGATSPEDVDAVLRGSRDDAQRNAASARQREILKKFQGRVDLFLARWGCSEEEALPLILKTFRRAFLLGSEDPETFRDLLLQIALGVFRETCGDAPRPRRPRGEPERAPAPVNMNGPLPERVTGLDSLTLRCLAVCSDPRPRSSHPTKEGAAAALFGLPEEDVHLRAELAGVRLGCSRDQLLSPAMLPCTSRSSDGVETKPTGAHPCLKV